MPTKKKNIKHLLIVYPDFAEDGSAKSNGGSYAEGIASISAVVKQGGHKVSLFHITTKLDEKEFKTKLQQYENVDLVGFSTRTTAFNYVKQLAKWTKEVSDKYFVFGGSYHAILAPQDFMAEDYFDAVCFGEGEYPILQVMDKMAEGKDYTDTESFQFKVNGKVIKNKIQPLIENLDDLPFPDIDLFDYDNLEATKVNTCLIMLSRGCIFSCTYCGNSQFRQVYPNKAKYARFRSPKKCIELIKRVLDKHPNIKFINFRDAIFNMFPDWFNEFIDMYIKEIHLPFTCNLRFDVIKEEDVKKLKEAGCYTIDLGLESGNKTIRQELLHRYTTDEQMIQCAAWFKKYKITVLAYNIVGLPTETIHEALETIKLNAKLSSDQTIPNIFTPYPSTILAKTAEDCGYEIDLNPKNRVFVKMPQFPPYQVEYVADQFNKYVKKYRWVYAKESSYRKLREKWLDFWFLGPLTPKRLIVAWHKFTRACYINLKAFGINHFPKLYLQLRRIKNKIR